MKTKYIHKLTDEELQEISDLCFQNKGEKIDHAWNKGDTHFVLVVSENGNEFYMYDFAINASCGYRTVEDANKLFAGYMYKKFGEEYLLNYANNRTDMRGAKEKLRRAEENMQKVTARRDSIMDEVRQMAQ